MDLEGLKFQTIVTKMCTNIITKKKTLFKRTIVGLEIQKLYEIFDETSHYHLYFSA